MGWCSATEIFDNVASALLDKKKSLSPEQVLERLIDALEEGDWDCQQDSAYYDHPLVRKIFQRRNPDWFEEEE